MGTLAQALQPPPTPQHWTIFRDSLWLKRGLDCSDRQTRYQRRASYSSSKGGVWPLPTVPLTSPAWDCSVPGHSIVAHLAEHLHSSCLLLHFPCLPVQRQGLGLPITSLHNQGLPRAICEHAKAGSRVPVCPSPPHLLQWQWGRRDNFLASRNCHRKSHVEMSQ